MGLSPVYKQAAEAMGRVLGIRGLSLVYGGAQVGLMGAIADAVLAVGGEAIGVIPEFMIAKEIAHPNLTSLHVVSSMHERKALMAEIADALPGGYGTLEEFCEILTWAQLGLHEKPQGLLNVEGYYTPLLKFFDQAVTSDFVKPSLRNIVLEASEPEALLASYQPKKVDKWSGNEIKL
jgi:uncharacterized protein (TIGR00730 family)